MDQEDPTLALRPARDHRAAGEAETLPADFAPSDDSQHIPRGVAIGRYLVLDPLGEGGMGVVYSAYDPELDRRIAIKVLRVGDEGEGSAGRSRLLREAQAMAKLAHPNVITVYDVGTFAAGTVTPSSGAGVFVAMELVEGWTLRGWQRHPGRAWREKLDVYIAAGRGLAAAHAAGLVHRDFKPDNVLIGRDRRVRVTDFGLVRAAAGEEPERPPVAPLGPGARTASTPLGSSPISDSLTAVGALLGTPHYMAPEQHRGQLADERSDQFSFCVAAWEALHGERPFAGETMVELYDAVTGEARRPPPAKSDVPARVTRALARGLAVEPRQRHASMNALLTELADVSRASHRRPSYLLAAGGILIGLGGVAFMALRLPPKPGALCAGAGDAVLETWNEPARARLGAAFAATGAPFAADAAAGAGRALDGWAASYRAMARASCKATRVEHTQSDSLGDLRQACLTRRLAGTTQLVERLAHADRAGVEDAVRATADLPDLAGCADVAALAARTPLPAAADARAQVTHGFAEVAAVNAARAAHVRTAELRPRADAAVEAARATGYPPLLAAALFARGRLHADADQGPAARDDLLAAAAAALRGNDDELLADAWIAMVRNATDLLVDYPDAARWAALADGAVARLAEPGRLELDLHRARAQMLRADGKQALARSELEAALALAEKHLAAPHPAIADTLVELGTLALDLGQADDAERFLGRALTMTLALYGANHPAVATVQHDLGIVAYQRGKYADAEALFTQALALRERTAPDDDRALARVLSSLGAAELGLGRARDALVHLQRSLALVEGRVGAEHPDVAVALNELGGAYHALGDYTRARDANLRALAIREKKLGVDHPDVGYSLVNVAIEEKALGQFAEVEKRYRRAIAIFEAKIGPEAVTTGIAYINYAEALRAAGKLDAALVAYQHARAIAAKSLAEDHPILGHVWNGVGQAELARGHVAAARDALEKALAIRVADPGDVEALSETRFALARALFVGEAGETRAGRDPERARQLALDAQAGFARLGPPFEPRRAEVERWLGTSKLVEPPR